MWIAKLLMLAMAGTIVFQEPFDDSLDDAWRWVREDADAWRLRDGGLEVRVQPGNLWGPANDARNVLVRPAPDARPLEVSVAVRHQPTGQYEQAGLSWYVDDSNMVKLVVELVDGRTVVVMGREVDDRGELVGIADLDEPAAELRLRIESDRLHGDFRPPGDDDWQTLGSCPLPGAGPGAISLQAYQGPPDGENWARFERLVVREL